MTETCEHRCSRGSHCGGCGCPGCGFEREPGDPRGPLPERNRCALVDGGSECDCAACTFGNPADDGWQWCRECQDLSRPGTGEFANYCVRCGSELVS